MGEKDCPKCKRKKAMYWDGRAKIYLCPWKDCEHVDRSKRIVSMERLIPKRYKKQYEKAISGRSRKAAMGAFCIECMGYVIKEVKMCIDTGCPLYPYRLR